MAAICPTSRRCWACTGLTVDDGLLVEDVSSSGRYYRQQLVLMPEIALTDEEGEQLDITKGFNSSSYVVLPECQAIRTPEMKQSGIVYTDVLTTSDKAYIKSNITENTTIDKQETDESGKFSVAVAMDKPDYENVEKHHPHIRRGQRLLPGQRELSQLL